MMRTLILILLVSQVTWAQQDSWIKSSQGEDGASTDGKCFVLHPLGDVFTIIAMGGKNTIEGQVIEPGGTISEDSYIARYKSNGEKIWIKKLFTSTEGYGINRVNAINVDGHGDLIVAGASFTMASFLGANASTGAFIAKFDSELNLKWIHYEPQVSLQDFRSVNAQGERIVIDKDDNIIWYTDQIYTQSFAEYGGLALIKYTSSGTRLWNKLITFNPEYFHPVLRGITMESNGTITVSGIFFDRIHFSGISFFNNQSVNVNRQQLFVARFTSAGDYLWAIQSNYGYTTVGLSHTSDIGGNIYLSGQFFGAGSQLITNGNTYIHEGDGQGFVAKIDPTGKLIWLNLMEQAYAWDIHAGRDGFLYLTGVAFGEFQYQSFKTPIEGIQQAFIIKIDDDGFYRGSSFSKTIDNTNTPEIPIAYGFQTITDADGNLYTQGSFRESVILGCVSATTENYHYSFFLIKHQLNQTPSMQGLTVTGPAGPFCESTVITLQTNSVSEIKKYKWFLPQGVTSVNGQTEFTDHFITLHVSPLASNKPIIVIGETDSACNVYYGNPYTVEILSKPTAPEMILSKNLVCPVTSEVFAVKRPETDFAMSVSWTMPAGVTAQVNAAADTAKLNFLANFTQGEITITATNTCGTASTNFQIQTFLNPDQPILSGDLILCAADVYIEKSTNPVAHALAYEWELPTFISHNPSLPNTSINLNALVFPQFYSGQIRVRAIGTCSQSEWSNPISISRVAPPGDITTIIGPDQICVDADGVVTYQVNAQANATQYIWTVPDVFLTKGTISTGSNHIDLKANREGNGIIKVHAMNTCQEKGDSVMISISTFKTLAQPIVQVTACARELIVSNATLPQWYYNGNLLPGDSQTSMTVLDSGIYFVRVKNFCGTQDSEPVQVYPVIPEKLFFPNVITPDGNGKNDFFKIDKSLTSTSLLILNRWGKEIYYTSDYQNDWMADDHPTGAYFYKISNSCIDMPIQGWINVVR